MEINYEPIIVVKDEQGNIKITEDQLKEMLKQAYNNGFAAGQLISPTPTIVYPQIDKSNQPPHSPFWYDWNKIYCVANEGVISNEQK
jgi:hypothetical protein